MRVRFERQISHAAIWSRRVGYFAVVLLLSGWIAHRFFNLSTPVASRVALFAASLALVAAGLSLKGFNSLWNDGDKGGIRSATGMAAAWCVLLPVGWFAWLHLTLPAIHDVSTDLADPPSFSIAARSADPLANPLGQMPAASVEEVPLRYPDVVARRLGEPLANVDIVLRELFAKRGWPVLSVIGTPGESTEVTYETTTRSLVIGFSHAISVRLTDEGETTFVDMRSALRTGSHDYGANARIIESFLDELDLAVATAVYPEPEQ